MCICVVTLLIKISNHYLFYFPPAGQMARVCCRGSTRIKDCTQQALKRKLSKFIQVSCHLKKSNMVPFVMRRVCSRGLICVWYLDLQN